jgi:hypothetical protein
VSRTAASRARSALGLCALLAVVLAAAAPAGAGLTSEKCLAAKAKAGGTLRKCRANAQAALVLGRVADFGKCQRAFDAALANLGEKAAKGGVECRFHVEGDGTIMDFDTGLQWEQKDSHDGVADLANPHDVDNVYTWTATTGGQLADGTVFTEFLGRLNGSLAPAFGVDPCASGDGAAVAGGFAGHCDWRLPTVAELASLVDQSVPGCGLGTGTPCIPAILGPTLEHLYWTSTTDAADPANAWEVSFRDATGTSRYPLTKGHDRIARAVRGGW